MNNKNRKASRSVGDPTQRKPIFVTAWFRRHGIAYFDILVTAIERALTGVGDINLWSPGEIPIKAADQYGLARQAGYNLGDSGKPLKNLDRAIMLVPKNLSAPTALSESRLNELVERAKWRKVENSFLASGCDGGVFADNLEETRNVIKNHAQFPADSAFPGMDWINRRWGERAKLLWHIINEAPLETQLQWYREHSPLHAANKSQVEFAELDCENLDDPVAVTRAMRAWVEKNVSGKELIVNLYGTATPLQFGWYFLAWRSPSLRSARFVQCRAVKAERRDGMRFAPVRIEVVQKDPISKIGSEPAPAGWESEPRREATAWLRLCLSHRDNFSILILGERGSGKTTAVKAAWESVAGSAPFVAANCANFADPDLARSELFGHGKKVFTDVEERTGLLERADGGLLFLDEVHLLDPITRSMLLTALQTDTEGRFEFRPHGRETKHSTFQPVFATNRKEADLCSGEHKLPADFLDRISQRIVHWPKVSNKERVGAWKAVLKHMNFKGAGLWDPIDNQAFLDWFLPRDLPGNFRDIERIAILVADYQRALVQTEEQGGDQMPLVAPSETLVGFLKDNFRSWSPEPEPESTDSALEPSSATTKPPREISIPFDITARENTEKEYLDQCRRAFVKAMATQYGTQKAAVAELKSRESRMTPARMSEWKRAGAKK